jgi:hypothetical protein
MHLLLLFLHHCLLLHPMHCTILISAHVYAYARSRASGAGIKSPRETSPGGVQGSTSDKLHGY